MWRQTPCKPWHLSAYKKGQTPRARRSNLARSERHFYSASITVQMPKNKRARGRCSCTSWAHLCTKVELPFEWGQGKKSLGVFMTAHPKHQIRFLWSKLHHIKDAPWHIFSSMHCHLSDKDSILCVSYPMPFCWWQTYPRISSWMLNGGFSLESEWFHFIPCASSFCCCLPATKTYIAAPWVQSNSSGKLLLWANLWQFSQALPLLNSHSF